MTGFSADWLGLREPHDHAARSRAVMDEVARAVAHLSPLRIVDLACGTGSTMRALAGRLPARQEWRLVDNDLGLLARAGASQHPPGASVTPTPVDLARDLEVALDGAVDLATTSALLDLVSDDWLERLVIEIGARRIGLYAALSYDGRVAFAPEMDFDAAIVAAVNAHQHGDKGFGPALGPDAASVAIARFQAIGYVVTADRSDWQFAPRDDAMQIELLHGWARAAQDTGRLRAHAIADWLADRLDALKGGKSEVRVGHVDFFARPERKLPRGGN